MAARALWVAPISVLTSQQFDEALNRAVRVTFDQPEIVRHDWIGIVVRLDRPGGVLKIAHQHQVPAADRDAGPPVHDRLR
jgi:ribosome maturation factor RimP